MDPDVALTNFRLAVAAWSKAVGEGDVSAEHEAASAAIEAATALDSWMSLGGFAPTAWQAKRNGMPGSGA
jgi:hypothetical protein